jgi:DNA mismatch repair protein MutS
MSTHKIGDEYFSYLIKYQEEYGEKVCVLMQIGSFYEMQMVKNDTEQVGNLTDIAGLLNIQVTKKNKSIDKVDKRNPFMAGFPKPALSKFLPILLENGYTVVIIDQEDIKHGNKVNRRVAGVYSPSIQPMDIIESRADECDLTSICIELFDNSHMTKSKVNNISYSLANLKLNTNCFDMYENTLETNTYEHVLDDIYRVLVRYDPKEVLLNIIVNSNTDGVSIPKQLQHEFLTNYLDLTSSTTHWFHVNNARDVERMNKYKDFSSVSFQNTFFKKTYKHLNFGMLEAIEYFDLEKHQLSTLNMMYIIDFVCKHDEKYVKSLATPTMLKDNNHLLLEMNTLQQLNILPNRSASKYNSLFHVINKTSTAVGRRGLRELLCRPMNRSQDIQKRYDLSQELEQYIDKPGRIQSLERKLEEISDFEKLHRKMSLLMLHPHEFCVLHSSYENILELDTFLKRSRNDTILSSCLEQETVDTLVLYMSEYTTVFALDEMRKYNLNETSSSIGNYFTKGHVPELDEIHNKICEIEMCVERVRKFYEDKVNVNNKNDSDWIKTAYSEQDGYFLTCTKIRCQVLQKELSDQEAKRIVIKNNTSVCKISTDELKQLSLNLINYRELFCKKIKLCYLAKLQDYADRFSVMFSCLKRFVETMDISKSNIKCKKQYKYCQPQIVESEESFIEAKQVRHPIIEKVNYTTEYVPNDVALGNNFTGMVLYALNSCGKSSLLRSIGISLVMAQCGLYVPCESFKFYPFQTIITQVDMYDNLWKGQSSFVSEMIGLRKILRIADRNTLVLSDELTKGTEVVSATSLFAASVLELVNRKCKFIFTTHLQDVAKLKCINDCQQLQICHLSVIIQDDEIIFERKLQDGPCSELYGLEVAKAIGLDKHFIDTSFSIRDSLINRKKEIVRGKRSRYNKSKLVDECEICGYCPTKSTDIPLDTHHIKFQCSADHNDFTGHYHKNATFNLVSLCKSCHQSVHSNKIEIHGYQQTTKGQKLSFTIQDHGNTT